VWISRAHYETLKSEIHDLRNFKSLASQYKAEVDGATRLLIHLEEELRIARKQLELDKQRADNAIDELLKQRDVTPVSTGAPERKVLDWNSLDSVFEEEDQNKVHALVERMKNEGFAPAYNEAIEELYANE
jgi:transcriptional regulatory protein LevR